MRLISSYRKIVVVISFLKQISSEICIDCELAGDFQIDFESTYWNERSKLVRITTNKYGDQYEQYFDDEEEYDDIYDDDFLDEKEEAFEKLPDHVKIDYLGENYNETDISHRELTGKLGRGYLESLCGRDLGKPCASTNFPELHCSNYGKNCTMDSWDCQIVSGEMNCIVKHISVDTYRLYDEPTYVTELANEHNITFETIEPFVSVDNAPCVTWDTIYGNQTSFPDGVTIPERTCVSMGNFRSGEILEFGDAINILGKFVFPDGTKVTLKFPMMYVQGKLKMRSFAVIDDEPEITFVLNEPYTAPDRYFVPHGENEWICPEGGCLVGKNGIVVAGGNVDIIAMPENCPTWSKIAYHETASMPHIPVDEIPQQAKLPENTVLNCTSTLFNEDFTAVTTNTIYASPGSIQEITNVNHTDNYLLITNRRAIWMGAVAEIFSPEKDCMLPNEVYFFSAMIRLSRPDGKNTLCATSYTNCPELHFSHMNSQEQLRWYKLATLKPDVEVVDGEWFVFAAEIKFTAEQLAKDDVLAGLYLVGPEEGVDMAIDDFFFRLPATNLYPPLQRTCEDLIINGRGDLAPGFTYPMSSWLRAEKLVVKYDDNGEPYYHLGPRHEEYSTITFDMMPQCLEDTVQYKFKARIWVHSDEPVRPRAIMKVHHERNKFPKPYHRDFHFDIITICDPTSESIGWITCEEIVQFEYYHSGSSRIQFLFLTSGSTADVSYADMEFTHYSGKQTGGLKLPDEIYGCWGAGPSAFITSEEILWDKDKVVNITEVREDGMIFLDVDSAFEMPSSVRDQGIYAPEVAIMRRNILFTAVHSEEDPYFGGFFLILKSPHRSQIEGIEIRNFGQQRNVAKYSLNVYHGGDHWGTKIAKNYIQDSNLRGVCITGTKYVNITENVFYNISGHAIVMEEGSETHNTIQYNLGARIIPIIIENNWWYQEQDDRARFILIKNPKNHFIGNVGTGGFWSAFWTQLHRSTHGESRTLLPPTNPRHQPFLTFVDNVAHSNRKSGIQFHPTYYWPETEQILKNTISYRNMWFGIYFFGTQYITLDGGHVADNRVGIDLNYVDKIKVQNFEVVGYSRLFKDLIDSTEKRHLCWEFEDTSPAIYGIRLHPNIMDQFDKWGVQLENVTFNRLYDDIGCPGSSALTMSDVFKDQTFSSKIAIKNVTFDEQNVIADKINFCLAEGKDLIDVSIYDYGDLNPIGDGPGWIVSRDYNMTHNVEACYPMNGSCAYYCKGELSCVTKVTVEVEFSDTDDIKLLVEDQENYVRAVQGYQYLGISEERETTNWSARRHFGVSLPEGNYTASFWRDGEMVWPGFAQTDIVSNWVCNDGMNNFDFIIPEPDPGYCDSLIYNGDMEKSIFIGDSEWHDTNGGLKYTSPAHSGDQAIANKVRTKLSDGLSQFFDERCLVLGQRWKISAWAMMSNNDECDFLSIDSRINPMCPRFSIKIQNGTEALNTQKMTFVGRTVPPYKPSEWNLIAGTFVVTQEMIDAETVSLFVDGPPGPALIYLDDVVTTPMILNCGVGENIVLNGEVDGDLSYWKYTGPIDRHRTGIELVNNADYGWGEGFSMKTIDRDQEWHGLKQDFIMDCIEVGKEYEVTVRYRLLENEDEIQCNPFVAYVTPEACPRPRVVWTTGSRLADQYFQDIGAPVGPNKEGEWHLAHGIFNFTEHLMDGADEQIEVFFGKNWPHKNFAVDSYSVALAAPNNVGSPSRCDPIIANGNAETGDARLWFIKGREKLGTIEIVSPGRGGAGYAFYHHGQRAKVYNGLWQKLNKRCLSVGRYRATAYFKLFDSTGAEISCDKTMRVGATRCPVLFFQAHTPGKPLKHYGPNWNTAPGDWVVGEWNKYEALVSIPLVFMNQYEIWFYVHNVLPGNGYYIDDISFEPV